MEKHTTALLSCGAPAPGGNAAFAKVVIALAERGGHRVIGIHGGFEALASKRPVSTIELSPQVVADWESIGGSKLITSRFNPAAVDGSVQQIVQQLSALGTSQLLVEGGDDTVNATNQIGLAMPQILIGQIPCTVDNDLPLPPQGSTLGFDTFVEKTAATVTALRRDAMSYADRWYIAVTLGRHTGHVAAHVANSGEADLAFIPEQWQRKVSLPQLATIILASILKQLVAGTGPTSGVVVVPASLLNVVEGDEKIDALAVDSFGRKQLTQVYVAHRLSRAIAKVMRAWEVRHLTVIGEGLAGNSERAAGPRGQDRLLSTILAEQAVQFLTTGTKNSLITTGLPIPFDQALKPSTGQCLARRVDVRSDTWHRFTQRTRPFGPEDFHGRNPLEAMATLTNLTADDLGQQIRDSFSWT